MPSLTPVKVTLHCAQEDFDSRRSLIKDLDQRAGSFGIQVVKGVYDHEDPNWVEITVSLSGEFMPWRDAQSLALAYRAQLDSVRSYVESQVRVGLTTVTSAYSINPGLDELNRGYKRGAL